MNEDTHEVTRAGTPIELTATEYKLLRYLMLNPRRVLSKAQILDRVWSYDFGGEANVVEIYISYLRKKLNPLGPPLIHTVRGFGYCLRENRSKRLQRVTLRLRLHADAGRPRLRRPRRSPTPRSTSRCRSFLLRPRGPATRPARRSPSPRRSRRRAGPSCPTWG